MSDNTINLYIDSGSFSSPFYTIYTDSEGYQELTPNYT